MLLRRTLPAVVGMFVFVLGTVSLAAAKENPMVVLSTSMGDIKVELYADKAPVSTKNFLDYAKAGYYDGTIFHRVIPSFMVQGGGLTSDMQEKREGQKPAIKNESSNGLKNETGTLAMANYDTPQAAALTKKLLSEFQAKTKIATAVSSTPGSGAAIYPGQSGADGLIGDHALVTPPMTITAPQVEELVAAIDRALTRLESEPDLVAA